MVGASISKRNQSRRFGKVHGATWGCILWNRFAEILHASLRVKGVRETSSNERDEKAKCLNHAKLDAMEYMPTMCLVRT